MPNENYNPVKIILTEEQAKRLALFLEDHIFNGMADVCESVNYQLDYYYLSKEEVHDETEGNEC